MEQENFSIVPLLDHIEPNNFINQYLTACGIDDVDNFLFPTKGAFELPWAYPNMNKGVTALYKAMEDNKLIGILVDSDADGFMSSYIIYHFIAVGLGYDRVKVFFHKLKAHGLHPNEDENLVQDVLDAGVGFMIVPDAGTGDVEESKILYEHDVPLLVLDHHPLNCEGTKAIIINHHFGQGLNTALSGTGVTQKFVLSYAETYHVESALPDSKYQDAVAVSIVSDVCDFRPVENRAYLMNGLKLFKQGKANPLLQLMADTLNRRGNTPIGMAFGMIPPINALCRDTDIQAKKDFFMGLVGFKPADEALSVARKAHRNQSKLVEKIVADSNDSMIPGHKALVGFTERDYKGYIGLAANKFCGQTSKPTILLREKNSTTWSGSLRSPIPLATLINQSRLANCQGHEEACGIEVKKSRLDKLIDWLDKLDIEAEPPVQVVAKISPDLINLSLCRTCDMYKEIWGANIGNHILEPKFYMEFNLTDQDILVCGKQANTLKISYKNVVMWAFRCSHEVIETVQNGGCFVIKLIGTLGVGNWNNEDYPEVKIDKFILAEDNSIGNIDDYF